MGKKDYSHLGSFNGPSVPYHTADASLRTTLNRAISRAKAAEAKLAAEQEEVKRLRAANEQLNAAAERAERHAQAAEQRARTARAKQRKKYAATKS